MIHTMFLKFIFNQDMFRMKHHPSSVVQFASFDVQAVMPVILVKPIDTSPLASVNISPPTNIPTSLSICEVLKIVAPGVQKTVL